MQFSPSQETEMNTLYNQYLLVEGNEKVTIFEKMYRLFKKVSVPDIKRLCRSVPELNESEIVGAYEDRFMKLLFKKHTNPINFVHYLSKSISNEDKTQVSLAARKTRIRKRYGWEKNIADTKRKEIHDLNEMIQQIPSGGISFEEEIIERLDRTGKPKTHRDKQWLLNELLSKTDDETRRIVQSFVSNGFNYRKTARELNSHHMTVKRKINKLSIYYNETKYGDVTSYLKPSE